MPPAEADPDSVSDRDFFATTHWSLVLAAGDNTSQQARQALELLCGAYWQPIYSFIRRQGHSPADAQDLTQSFVASLLAHQSLRNVSPLKGRFRAFLVASLKYFLADEWDKARAGKRGGHATIISLDAQRAENRYALEPTDEDDPERIFERRWALTLLDRTLSRLESEIKATGREARWRDLKGYLLDDADAPSYPELAARLNLSVSAIKTGVLRLRQRFAELLRVEIAATVGSEGEIEDEFRHLLAVLRRRSRASM